MADSCCSVPPPPKTDRGMDPKYRRILWIALAINAAMFAVEVAGSIAAGSVSLLADAIDFAGDAANYGLSLAVLSMGLAARARAALVKGASMGAYGIFVVAQAWLLWRAGTTPEPITMGAIAVVALVANLSVAAMLYAWREGDANMRSVWLCSRNDAISNIAVLIAALGVFGTGSAWPDLVVAALMAALAITSSVAVVRQAVREMGKTGITPA